MLIGALLFPNCIPPKAPWSGGFDASFVSVPDATPEAVLCALCGAASAAEALATAGDVAAAGADGGSGLAASGATGAITIGGAVAPGGTVAAVVTGVESGATGAGADA